jgi:hypothetical protein
MPHSFHRALGLRHRVGKLAFELFPPVVTNKGAGNRRLIEAHGLTAVFFYPGGGVSETDAFMKCFHRRR